MCFIAEMKLCVGRQEHVQCIASNIPRNAVEVSHRGWRENDVRGVPVVCNHERAPIRFQVLTNELRKRRCLSATGYYRQTCPLVALLQH